MTDEVDTAVQYSLRRKALLLVWIGEGWNVVEAGVALWSGVSASSAALVAFGLDSLIELFAGGVLIWHLSKEWNQGDAAMEDRRAERLVGITFLLLSVYILIQSSGILLGWFPEPRVSFVGITLAVVSAAVMLVLYFGKMDVAKKLGSRALRAEAVESLFCDLQDLTLLIGLGLNALLGWWWADPVAALVLVPFLLREGWEAFFEQEEE